MGPAGASAGGLGAPGPDGAGEAGEALGMAGAIRPSACRRSGWPGGGAQGMGAQMPAGLSTSRPSAARSE